MPPKTKQTQSNPNQTMKLTFKSPLQARACALVVICIALVTLAASKAAADNLKVFNERVNGVPLANPEETTNNVLSPEFAAGVTFADPRNHERQRSEHAVRHLRHIIVIYQENWSFDSLYGQFPGANGLEHGFDTLSQYDKSTNYTSLTYKTPRPSTTELQIRISCESGGQPRALVRSQCALPLFPLILPTTSTRAP